MGVTILAALAAIGGVLGLCASLALVGLGGLLGGLAAQAGAPAGAAAVLGGFTGIFGILILVLSVLELAFAYGAWTLKPWAWTLGVVVAGASIVLSLINVLGGDLASPIISLAINGIILYYLFTPEVKRAFGRA
jgi:hypothetical protein